MDLTRANPNSADMPPFPDVMNDPAFDEREKGFEEMDTCRICHGEATEEEPLFYPCKCSGSIKFVHQSCLVEWLSHSQKKHCELCKTPFRFTKLYDPNMPQNLPTPLFLKQAVIQSCRTLVTWMRFLLVAFVWLGWLPWSMRAIWRALFWLADGRWSTSGASQQRTAQSAQDGLAQLAANGSASISSMVSTASNAIKSAASTAPSQQAAPPRFPAGDPLMLTLIKKVIPNLFIPVFAPGSAQGGLSANGPAGGTKSRYPSWLSDVKLLNTLTPYPTINNMIIDTLEGQLITLLVVVAFILLFLIREWVVQQQPMANIPEGEREAALQLIANNAPEQARAPPVDADPARPNPQLNHEHDDRGDERISAPQSPAPSWTDSDDGLPVLERPGAPHDVLFGDRLPDNMEHEFGSLPSEHHHHTSQSGASTSQDVLARANGDREEMRRIIREEGHNEELGWVINAFNPSTPNESVAGPSGQVSLEATDTPRQMGDQNTDAMNQPRNVQQPHAPESPNNDSLLRGNTVDADAQDREEAPKGLLERLLFWFWGDIALEEHDHGDEALADDEQIVQDPALEDPFVPVHHQVLRPPAEGGMGMAADDAGLDANDIDAIEGDDFEGIMDLIGMQGPIFGLLQNGVFCALLIAFTVAVGIWLPYLWGKIALVLLANPLELILGVPMTAVTVAADIALDTLIGVVGYVMYWLSFALKTLLSPFGAFVPIGEWIPRGKSVTSASLSLIDASTNRLNKVIKAFLVFHESDIPMFSVLSHQALKLHQARIASAVQSIFIVVKFTLHDLPLRLVSVGFPGALSFNIDYSYVRHIFTQVQQQLGNVAKSPLFASGTRLMNATAAKAGPGSVPVDYELAVWDTKDRVIAISMGYLLATVMGFLYLRITGFLTGTTPGQRIEGIVAEVLFQAGGVMKVILIIGIEMIVFPLYCGTLLDLALLPLFPNATVASRIAFTTASPFTSLFVHWFIGTCYMFHFALFVSMCRKILRSGVLCESHDWGCQPEVRR